MHHLCFLSMLSASVVCTWEGSGCRAMMMSSGALRQVLAGRAGVSSQQRMRRSWVWNQFFVPEEHTGDEPLHIGKLHSDMDKGDGQVKYFLSGEGASSIFTIDKDTGDIHTTQRLDREQQAYYTLTAQARDQNSQLLEPESQFIIKVQDINDNAPRFLDGHYMARVAEGSPVGTSVVTVAATDADDPTYGNSARLVYSILQGQPYFTVEPKTGVVRTGLPDLDRESSDCYLLIIQAKDMIGQMGGLSGTTTVTVTLTDINDNPPRFPNHSYQFTIPESSLLGSVVAEIRAVDLDVGANAEMDYRILDEDGPVPFRIHTDLDTQEGRLTLQQTLDFEVKSSYTFRVEASNQNVDTRFLLVGPFSDVAMIQVLVEDVDEPPEFLTTICQMEVSEDAPAGSSVGSVSARDPDSSNSPVRYSIDRKSDVGHYFDIDSISGFIRTSRRLDREVTPLHNITIVAMETVDRSQLGTAVVLIYVRDINDNAPCFAVHYQTFVCENAPPGQVVQTLSATDPDETKTGHHFLFALTAEATTNSSFTLRQNHDNTAVVLTRGGGFQRQNQPLHFLPVVISDGGSPSLSSTNTLTITICKCDLHGNHLHCNQSVIQDGLGTAAVATLTCILTLLGVVMVTTALRCRGTESLLMDEERAVWENIVHYNNEGGGEEDTEAFDMLALRHLMPPSRTQNNWLLQEFIRDQLQEAHLDLMVPPFDSLQTYIFEGSWSEARSLSSLNSLSSGESEMSYAILRAWGPQFQMLADLYDGEGVAHQNSEN